MPVLLVLFAAIMGIGVVFFQVGRASTLSAEAQSAADAAALGAATEMREQLMAMIATSGFSDVNLVDEIRVRAAAEDWARRNGATVTSLSRDLYRVTVEVVSLDSLGEDAELADSEGARSERGASAELKPSPIVLGAIGGVLATGGSGDVPATDWEDLSRTLGGSLDIVALGRFLQEHGFAIGEHPAFDPVDPVHVPNSWHYRNGAIDVNFDTGNEMAAMDEIAPRIRALGFNVLWRVEDHFDHLHADIGAPGPDFAGAGMFGPASFEIRLVSSN